MKKIIILLFLCFLYGCELKSNGEIFLNGYCNENEGYPSKKYRMACLRNNSATKSIIFTIRQTDKKSKETSTSTYPLCPGAETPIGCEFDWYSKCTFEFSIVGAKEFGE